MRESRLRLLTAVVLALVAVGAHPAHPLITEDTGTQGKNHWQLEVNGEKTRDRADGVTTRGFQGATTLSYGAADNIDLQLTLPYLRQETDGATVSGQLDTSIDLKWRFYENERLSMAVKPGLTLPSGRDRDGFGAGHTTWGAYAILSYEVGAWAFHLHSGYRYNRNTLGQRESLRHFSGAMWFKATEQVKIVFDHSLDTNPDPSAGGTIRQTVLGVIYSVTPDFDLDVGVRRGNDPATDRALLAGVTLRW